MIQEDLDLIYKKDKTFEEVIELHQKRFNAAIKPYIGKRPYQRLCTNLVSINMDLMRYIRNLKEGIDILVGYKSV